MLREESAYVYTSAALVLDTRWSKHAISISAMMVVVVVVVTMMRMTTMMTTVPPPPPPAAMGRLEKKMAG